jgi:hypothetical protein
MQSRQIKRLEPGPRVTAAGFSPVKVELVPIREGEVKVKTTGFDMDTGAEIENLSTMTDEEADRLAIGMIDYGWQEVPIGLR